MKERVVCRESIEWVDIAPLSLIHLLSKEDDCDQRKGGWDTGDGWVGAVQKIQKLSDLQLHTWLPNYVLLKL